MQLTAQQKQLIREHENSDVRELALRKPFFGRADAPFLLAQIEGRQIAKQKIPSWHANDEIVYPVHVSIEQASSETTARYKASLLANGDGLLVDLTGGLGVDFSFLSPHFQQAVYVEQNEELCSLALSNFAALELKNAAIKNSAGEEFLQQLPAADVIYLDPSRRDGAGRKVFRIEDCSPNVAEIKDLLLEKATKTLLKFSPMLDISLAVKTLQNVCQVHVVSVENECKELLFLLAKNAEECVYHTVNLKKNGKAESFSFRPEDEQRSEPVFTSRLGKYMYEPNASALKAGAFNVISTAFSVEKLHKNSHLYTSDSLVPDFPGRIFQVKHTFVPNKKNIRQFVSETKKANISVRNFPMSVAEIRRQSGLKDGGDIYLFATTLAFGQKVWIVCEKASAHT